MKKVLGITASLTFCVICGITDAKNLDATVDNAVTIGTAQTVSTVPSIVIAQPIEGQYSGNVAVALGSSVSRSITGGVGGSITGGRGSSITGGVGGSITGGVGGSITGGRGS